MSKRIEVWLDETSEPIVHDAISTYTKGLLYCVYCTDERVHKYPITRMFRVVEGYGTHGSGTPAKLKEKR